jgi:aryl-phospho-beta-D-glucosidase BglC (GH1 family)
MLGVEMKRKVLFLSLSVWISGFLTETVLSAGPLQESDAQSVRLPDRMRGINTKVAALKDDLFTLLKETDVNIIRINFGRDVKTGGKNPAPDDPLAPYKENLDILDKALPVLRSMDIRLILAAADIYGRDLDVMWKDTDRADAVHRHLAEFWKAIALRYKGNDVIVAYDILNEPNYPNGMSDLWYKKMLPASVQAIRSIDQNVWLVVEPGPWGLPGGFSSMPLLDDDRVIYSFHHYAPHTYTHQGILSYKNYAATYPGTNKMFVTSPESFWDKAALQNSMQAAIDFAAANHVRILVGEFSAIRWAPGAAKWLEDSIAVFEEQGWDWCYHCLGDWNGWNPTYGADAAQNRKDADGGERTERWNILINAWQLNQNN